MTTDISKQDTNHAALAHGLYLLNISFLPVIAFALIVLLWKKSRKSTNYGSRNYVQSHITQALMASITCGILLVGFSILILLFGTWSSPYTWMLLILYFTCIHSVLIFFGVYALTCAINGKIYHYPLVSRFSKHLSD